MDIDFKNHLNSTDITSVNDYLHPNVKSSVTKIAKKEGYIHYEVYNKMISTEGGNHMGILYEIDINGETVEGTKRETNIFVKQAIPNADDLKVASLSEIYNREVFVYKELAPIITELQNKANIPMKERIKLAKMYDESNTDAIMLENIAKQGFKTYGKMEVMNLKYAELCVQHLAKFHGMGFVIERKLPEYHESKIESLTQVFTMDPSYKIFINNMYEMLKEKLSIDQKVKTDEWWKTALDDYTKYLQGTMTDIKCLCHGDFKMNNVMYNETEGEITEVRAVDYQITHYGSPILDLIIFIYTGTDKTFREQHLNQLIDLYYVTLKKYLEYFDILVDDVYSRKIFNKDFNDCLEYALISCVWLVPVTMASKEEDFALGDYETMHLRLKFDDRCFDRVKDIFGDYFKWDI